MREEGSFYYLTENTGLKKFQGSLEPPLGSSTFRKSDGDVGSDNSACRSLVAQTSTESCTTGGLTVEEQPEETAVDGAICPAELSVEAESETAAEGALMMDSTITLVSNSDGETLEQRTEVTTDDTCIQSDSPLKKSSKRRFESGTTSIPGISLTSLDVTCLTNLFVYREA